MRWLVVVPLFLGCAQKPAWVESCACADGQICRAAFAAYDPEGEACIDVPEACAAAFADSCDLSLIDDACLEAACGAVPSGHEAECWADSAQTWRSLSCESSL